MLNNIFSYTQLSFVFLIQKDYYFNHDDTDAFFLFFLQKDFYICLEAFLVFLHFLLRKDFDIFHVCASSLCNPATLCNPPCHTL